MTSDSSNYHREYSPYGQWYDESETAGEAALLTLKNLRGEGQNDPLRFFWNNSRKKKILNEILAISRR